MRTDVRTEPQRARAARTSTGARDQANGSTTNRSPPLANAQCYGGSCSLSHAERKRRVRLVLMCVTAWPLNFCVTFKQTKTRRAVAATLAVCYCVTSICRHAQVVDGARGSRSWQAVWIEWVRAHGGLQAHKQQSNWYGNFLQAGKSIRPPNTLTVPSITWYLFHVSISISKDSSEACHEARACFIIVYQ